MGFDVHDEIVIEQSVERVSAFVADLANIAVWSGYVKSSTWLTDPPLMVTSKIRLISQYLGREFLFTYEVIEYAPGFRLVMRVTDGNPVMETTYTWQAEGENSTLMTLRNRGVLTGLFKLGANKFDLAMRKTIATDLAALKDLLEHHAWWPEGVA